MRRFDQLKSFKFIFNNNVAIELGKSLVNIKIYE